MEINLSNLQQFYIHTYNSFRELCALFKVKVMFKEIFSLYNQDSILQKDVRSIRIKNFMPQVDKKENGARFEDPGLKMEFFYSVNDAIDEMVIQTNY